MNTSKISKKVYKIIYFTRLNDISDKILDN